MRKLPLFIVTSIAVAVLHSPASAQMPLPTANMPTSLDCGTPQNAIQYYCMHRDEFDSDGRFTGPRGSVVGANPGSAVDVGTTGSVVVQPPAARRTQPRQ